MFSAIQKRLRKGVTIGGLVIFRENAGVISPGFQWVIFEDEFMYNGDTLFQAIKTYVKEHRADKHMID